MRMCLLGGVVKSPVSVTSHSNLSSLSKTNGDRRRHRTTHVVQTAITMGHRLARYHSMQDIQEYVKHNGTPL